MLPVRIDHPSIRTSDTPLPSNELFEPTLSSEKEPTIDAIQIGNGDEENGFVTATSTTKESALAVEILMNKDCPETLEDGDLTTVVLADKGKSVDPREYSSALDDSNSIIVLVGTTSTSTGGSDSINLIGVHQDKGENVNPGERTWNEMVKYKPGPSRIDFVDHEAMSFQNQGTPLESFEPTKMTDINDGLTYDPTLYRRMWYPKLSPYRCMVFAVPLAIGTVKAVLSLNGSVTTPITLEWILGVVIYLM